MYLCVSRKIRFSIIQRHSQNQQMCMWVYICWFFFIVNILALVEYNISFVATTNVVFVVGFSLFSHLSTYYFCCRCCHWFDPFMKIKNRFNIPMHKFNGQCIVVYVHLWLIIVVVMLASVCSVYTRPNVSLCVCKKILNSNSCAFEWMIMNSSQKNSLFLRLV